MGEPEDKKLNWRQACELLGCGRNRFYALIREGYLPAYRLWVYEKDCMELTKRIGGLQPS